MSEVEQKEELIEIGNFLSNKEIININDKNYARIIFLYNSALKELKTKTDILTEELKYFYDYNPIEYVVTRIKETDSIIKKLNKKKYDLTYENMIEKINDIAGMRIICAFKEDIYKVVEQIECFHDIRVLTKKDYMKKPKKSGYMSYHMLVEVPINFSKGIIYIKVEIQIRTMGMDFWAGLEHKINYKNEKRSKKQSKELVKYAKMINNIDSKMFMMLKENIKEEKKLAKNIKIAKKVVNTSKLVMST